MALPVVPPALWPPIPPGDPLDVRGPDGKHHIGCMITQNRAIAVATALFPSMATDGTDCQNEGGSKKGPCRHCAAANEEWADKVAEVRRAMIAAFS